ncbi:hypothetical protein SUGI_1040860 [Cryptomeria japonica]|nr:hypothetical protein SUGI_1040860 [Cryptomeria japonica]
MQSKGFLLTARVSMRAAFVFPVQAKGFGLASGCFSNCTDGASLAVRNGSCGGNAKFTSLFKEDLNGGKMLLRKGSCSTLVNRACKGLDSLGSSDRGVSMFPIFRTGLDPNRPLVDFDADIFEEVKENELYFLEMGLIGHFHHVWSSLAKLHKWITNCWKPILKGDVQIYSGAWGFFVVVFDNEFEWKKIMCEQLWWWDEKHMLLLKPWYPAFNPTSEAFDKIPVWVRLPNLPL